ncbi:MAG: DNA polymerase I [Patescibacteria group bacterium]|nr:DNA polymerase I [Patescibacteria group bacterium]
MSKKQKFLLIDSNALIHRSFHALPPLRIKTGEFVGAVYGFTSTLLKAIEDIKPDFVAAAFDLPAPTFRHEEYKEYKATRTKAPDELYEQIPYAKEVLTALNIPIYALAGFEADDLIGTLCKRIDDKKLNIDTYILTGDMDTLQLVDDNTRVYTLKKGIKDTIIYDESLVEQKYGFGPDRVIDYKALRGDPSDNIPGVKGIGEKTATDLIKKYGSLDGIYKAINENAFAFSASIKDKLISDKENAYLSKKLATIRLDVPIKIEIEDCCTYDFDKAKATAVFQKFEFRSLMGRLLKLVGDKNKVDGSVGAGSSRPDSGAVTAPLQNPKYILVNTQESFDKFFNELKKQKEFAIDTETSFLGAFESDLVGISFSWKAGMGYYIPVGHTVGNSHGCSEPDRDRHACPLQLDKKFVLEKLKPILENEKVKKIGQNIKYDLLVLKKVGININGVYFDTMIASYLMNPTGRGNSLDVLAFSEFGHENMKITELIGTGAKQKSFAEVSVEDACDYSGEDSDITWRLYEVFKERLQGESRHRMSGNSPTSDVGTVENIFYNIEMPLVKILTDMEFWGVKIDDKFLGKLSAKVGEKIAELEKKIIKMAGVDFNINSTQQLSEVLYKKLGIWSESAKKTKTGISTGIESLEKLKDDHPIIKLILEYRGLAKLQSTYLEALPKLISEIDGRVHTSYNQTIASTGRLSSSDPNLQNIPIRTDLGAEIRKAFIAEKGKKLLICDYSQVELRVAASIANDKKMLEAFNSGRDIHTETAEAIFDIPSRGTARRAPTKDERRVAKVVNFGIIYGISPYGLAQATEKTPQEAGKFMEEYFKEYPSIKKYMDSTIVGVQEKGYVETLLGRRRYIPDINSGVIQIKKAAERMAINMPIQGTAADIMKLAMLKIDEEILQKDKEVKMILQVHDELVFEIDESRIKNYESRIKEIMESVFKLKCPLIVETSVGENWGEK